MRRLLFMLVLLLPACEVADEGADVLESDPDAVAFECKIPQAPVLPVVHRGAVLDWSHTVEAGMATEPEASVPADWSELAVLDLSESGLFKVFARSAEGGCEDSLFSAVYEVREHYPPPPGEPGTTAVEKDDPAIVGWATGFVEPVAWGPGVDEDWQTPERALGPAVGGAGDVASLGRGGAIVLTFDPPITDGPGYDLAVFENGMSDSFLELAWVEVSSDGVHFERFDGVSLTEDPVGAFGGLDTKKIGSLAGKYRAGWGTPFDLGTMILRPAVLDGDLDLGAVTHVRIVDIVGDGSATDSFGNTIYDPHPTTGSAGFDLDAVAALHQAE